MVFNILCLKYVMLQVDCLRTDLMYFFIKYTFVGFFICTLYRYDYTSLVLKTYLFVLIFVFGKCYF